MTFDRRSKLPISTLSIIFMGAIVALSSPSSHPFSAHAAEEPPLTLTVHADSPGLPVSPDLYGVFFEEINHAGDGGLYAEMVRNRDFSEPIDSKNKDSKNKAGNVPGWSVSPFEANPGVMVVEESRPLNDKTPRSLRLTAPKLPDGAHIALVNTGYWGMNVRKGAAYNLSLYARGNAGYHAPLTVSLEGENGQVHAHTVLGGVTEDWKRFSARLTSTADDPAARLVISPAAPGTLWLDLVSLFPANTFKKRANGLRTDLAQHVEALHPAFVRFPGGCYVEGNVLANRFNWKNTLGDVALRPGHLNDNWNYRSTDGLGYHEYLQWCEDMRATPLFVVNCGMSHKEFVPVDQLQTYLQDALDAIEYANGPVTSKWGALRAQNGHPTPFNLHYVEIGNENGLFGPNFGGSVPQYAARYQVFYDAIKQRYPDMHTIADTRVPYPMELVDDHYYNSPAWFWANIGLYDTYNRSGPKVYVGEYAVTSDCGTGNLKAALAEAAWMTGMERNADVVKMSSYAPLFVNANDRKWNPDAIVFDSAHSYGTPSYHVQKLFATNRPDVSYPVDVPAMPAQPGKGGIGLGTWLTQAEYKDIEVIQDGKPIYASDFPHSTDGWKSLRGEWSVVDGAYRQSDGGTDRRVLLDVPALKNAQDYTLRLKARKLGGAEGFLILFRTPDENNNYWWNIGGWQNREHGIEKNVAGSHLDLGPHVQGHIEPGRWYDIRVEAHGTSIRCYIDAKLIFDVRDRGIPTLAAIAGKRDKTGEIIVKVVNGAGTPRSLALHLEGVPALQPTGQATVLTGDSLEAENSLTQPEKIVPRTTTLSGIASHFAYTAPARSLTILRLKQK